MKATPGDANIEAHHRGQKLIADGGVMDEIEEFVHRRDGNHTRHQLPSVASRSPFSGSFS